MNWKLILQLSMFGLAMGLATVFFIPSTIEPAFWLAIFLVCGLLIARQCPDRRFMTGVLLGMANSVWITGAHVLFSSRYLANHAREAETMKALPVPAESVMVLAGAISGIVFGVVIGVLAVLAGKVLRKAMAEGAR
jgi:uncharacterized membrane protein